MMSRNYIFHNSEGLCFKDLLDNIVAFKERPHERIRAAAGGNFIYKTTVRYFSTLIYC